MLSLEHRFTVSSPFSPAGDQPRAIEEISTRINSGTTRQTLLGITGSGKTFTVANIIQTTQKPALVIAHNKTLAGQLCNEFKEFFPENKVEYFISYYDYYQPESYIPHTDTYIEKTAKVNDDIDRLRHSTTKAIYERNDVIAVASVSCIYGLGIPELYFDSAIPVSVGDSLDQREFIRALVENQYGRNDMELLRGLFRVRGEIIEILQPNEERILRVEFFGDEVERIAYINPVTGEVVELTDHVKVFPAKHYVANDELLEASIKQIEKELNERVIDLKSTGKDFEAQRLLQRTKYDIEMLKEVGYCSGIENYSRILEQREPGSAPTVLIDYFNRRYGEDGWVCYIDESHMTLPQLKAMYNGDQSRKQVLVDYGFRLPCAKDNRPLKYEEFNSRIKHIVYISATPGDEELEVSQGAITELIIRPTGLVDPLVEIKATKGQIDVLMEEIQIRTDKGDKVIVNTLTKKMAEDLSAYLFEHNIRARYLHSEIKSLERIKLLRDLRMNEFDVIVGVNLLREGIDLPEVSLVCIMDADKEGYLRNHRTLIQMIGRAARNADSKVILFADRITESMQKALEETRRRQELQLAYNEEHNIVPKTIKKSFSNPILDAFDKAERAEDMLVDSLVNKVIGGDINNLGRKNLIKAINKLEDEMKIAAKDLEFEKAAIFRDQLKELREKLEEK
jgi:excinuclease ABC subunit B